jgi:dephospho-CoA kinase
VSLRIGLTGGIGSGKSTVAGMLVDCGAALVDTDLIARELTLPQGAAMPAIEAEFGAAMLDTSGALDRAAMRERVFADPDTRQRLEAILHPLIRAETRRRADAATALGAQAVVFDVPLLVESGRWRSQVDKILVVDCLEATQVERVMQRSAWPADAVRAVIAQQATRDQRRAVADAVICNDRLTRAQLADQVRSLWQRWSPLPT